MVKLQAGQVFKNYKELCNHLDEPIKTGKSKQLQLLDFERYFTYHKEGNKFIVDEVFSDPKPKIDNRVNNGGNNTKYETLMDDIIIDILLNVECEISASFTDLFRTYIPLITEEYTDGKIHGFEYLQKKHDMSIGLINTYSNKTKDMIKGSFETALNRLQRQGLLYWSTEFVVIKSRDGQDYATEEEVEMIKKAEKDIYELMEIKPFKRINPDVNKEFKEKVVAELQEEDHDIFGYWKVYHIIADDSIENIEITQPDIKELTNRYINSIHEKILNYEMKSKDDKIFNPYQAKKHIDDMLRLDLLFWEQYEGLEQGFTFDNLELTTAYYWLGDVVAEDNPIEENTDIPTYEVNWDKETGIYFPF